MNIENSCQLVIMRHAKSDWDNESKRDFERPLAKRGITDAHRIADWLHEQGIFPDIIIASPAVRAKQTALIVAEHLKKNEHNIIWDEDVYEAALVDLIRVIDRHSKEHKKMLLIGHNPGLDMLLRYLSDSEPERTPSGKLLTTAAIAILDFENGRLETKDHGARLSVLIRPKQLA
jgi:phosphohistidine phosphatase